MSQHPNTLDARGRLRDAGLSAKKSWGQHFLHDRRVLTDIVAAAGLQLGDAVLELGAGLGALTEALLAVGAQVTAVERDRDLAPLLVPQLGAQLTPPASLTVLEADAARLDYAALAQSQGSALRVLGNLPYQISSRILVSIADAGNHVAQATILVQREVAERLAAPPGSRTFGLLSVLVQRRFAVKVVRKVPPGAFSPPPKVDSAVVHLHRRATLPWAAQASEAGGPLAKNVATFRAGCSDALAEALLVRTARAAFSARRKVLANSLAQGLGCKAAVVQAAIAAVEIDPGCRAETLGVDDFLRLGWALAAEGLIGEQPV